MNVNKEDVHFTSEKPSAQTGNKIRYGPYANVEPLSFASTQIFYTYPWPLPKFTTATRDIYVSHWGQIAVDEYYKMFNEAAGIKGQFSRIDYMPHINPNQGMEAINSIDSNLP